MNRLWLIVTVAVLAVSIVVNWVLGGGYGYYAFLGFASALAMVAVAKALGLGLVERPEDYYERDADA